MTLQKLIHSHSDIESDDGKNTIIVHGVLEVANGGEFTMCGRAIPDSSLSFEGWEAIGKQFKGNLKKCDCKDCIKIINYFKSLR